MSILKKECDQCQIEMPLVNDLEKAQENGIEGGVFTFVDAFDNEDAMCIFCEDWVSGTDNIAAYVEKWGVEEFDKRFGWRHAGNVPACYR